MEGKNSFIKGAVILGAAGLAAKLMGLFFRWPVTMLIGDEGIGIYQLAYPVYMFIIGIMSGFPIAISKMVSERMALGKKQQAFFVFKSSFLILLIMGMLSSLLLYICAPFLIKALRWRKDSYYTLVAVAFAPLFVAIMSSFRGYFQGLQMMMLPAASQIVEQLGRVAIGVGLTYLLLPYGISFSAAGASFGACAGAMAGCALLITGYIKNKNHMVLYSQENRGQSMSDIIRELISIAIPISLGMTVGSIMSLIDSVVVPSRLLAAGFSERTATELYGQLTGKAHVLVNVPLTFSMALSTSLVPAMSEVKALRNVNKIKTRAENAVKLSLILGLPSAAGLFVLADPILHLIFPGRSEGVEVLQVLSASVVFIVLAQTLVGILQGVGNVTAPVKNLMIGALVKLLLVYILTPMPLLNVRGAAISSIAGYFVAAVLDLKDVMRYTYFDFDIDRDFLRPLLSTIVMAMAVYFVYNKTIVYSGSSGTSTIISVITGIIVYVVMLLISGAVSLKEIGNIAAYKRKR